MLEFVTFLNTHAADLPQPLKGKASLLVFETKKEIASLAEAKTFEAKKTSGSSIYYKIAGLMSDIKALADDKKGLT